MVSFTVDCVPVPKMRPRVMRNGHAYTPKKALEFETMVRETALRAVGNARPLEGAVRLDVGLYFPIPSSWPKGKRLDALHGAKRHICRPDADNCYKSVADALNGVCYKDDGQIVIGGFSKFYSEHPRIEVRVEEA